MLDHFLFSVNAVAPLFLMLALGFILKSKEILDPATVRKINTLVFSFALPVMLFRDISKSNFSDVFDWTLLLYAVVSTLIIFCAAYVFTTFFIKEKASHGAFVQGCFRGNYAIIGLPLIANILGPSNSGRGAVITTFIVPLYNILAVFVLTNKNGKESGHIEGTIKNIVKNPLIIGILLGIPFSVLSISLPSFINTAIDYTANLATPLALLAIGAVIEFKQPLGKIKLAVIASIFKIVLIPIIFIAIAISLGMRGENLTVLFVLYAAPTAVSSYIMAANLGNDSELAANIILLTTICSVFTYTLGIFTLKYFQFI